VNWEIFGFSNFHRSNLLDKRLAIGLILGNWEGFLVNWKIQNPNPHWKLDFGKLTGLRRYVEQSHNPSTCHKIRVVKPWGRRRRSSIIPPKTMTAIFVSKNQYSNLLPMVPHPRSRHDLLIIDTGTQSQIELERVYDSLHSR
jgi:hypothetical protein